MRLLLLGPPGSGKGTQGQRLSDRYRIPHIATGEMIREEIARQSAFGQMVQDTIAAGEFAPDKLVADWVHDRVAQSDCGHGYILDGFPRDIAQAEAWEQSGSAGHPAFDHVIDLTIDAQSLIQRLTGRLVCPVDGEIYHAQAHPPRIPGRCDLCGSALVRRQDDRPEVIAQRLKVYDRRTRPLREYYKVQGTLISVDADRGPAEVNISVLRRLCGTKSDLVEV